MSQAVCAMKTEVVGGKSVHLCVPPLLGLDIYRYMLKDNRVQVRDDSQGLVK
jgi:hypothetical protein